MLRKKREQITKNDKRAMDAEEWANAREFQQIISHCNIQHILCAQRRGRVLTNWLKKNRDKFRVAYGAYDDTKIWGVSSLNEYSKLKVK